MNLHFPNPQIPISHPNSPIKKMNQTKFRIQSPTHNQVKILSPLIINDNTLSKNRNLTQNCEKVQEL